MAEEPHPELVIIKRHGGHADGHHGGAWKIAFADFMTAMMALFLVLWLISATNPKQRIVIAHYFNPVHLAETSVDKKGLNDPTGSGPSRPAVSAAKEESKEKHLELPPLQEKRALFDRGQQSQGEAALFRDPYAVLSEIATQARLTAGPQDQMGGKGPNAKMEGDTSAAIPDTFRDPFATIPQTQPQPPETDTNIAAPAQQQQAAAPEAGDVNDPAEKSGQTKAANEGAATGGSVSNSASPDMAAPQPSPKVSGAAALKTAEMERAANSSAGAGAGAKEKPAVSAQRGGNGQGQMRGSAAQQIADARANESDASKLRTEIANAFHKDVKLNDVPNVEVKSTDEGVLISLTDEANYAMFAVGSAEPQAKTIEVMEKIAQLLKNRPGMIVVRGHTDGRRYKSGNYDNWQLSAARAQMAHYMLVRGGFDEKRIERIEGYADHRLKIATDPNAAENRRIEILLRKDKQ